MSVVSKSGISFSSARVRGFTLVELITVIILVGILSVSVMPRFFDQTIFLSRGFSGQVLASVRYAQKMAVALRQYTCVSIAGNVITLTQGATSICGGNLPDPAGQSAYSITAPNGVTVGNASFYFDALGRPNFTTQQTITISGGAPTVLIEAETGYVHQ